MKTLFIFCAFITLSGLNSFAQATNDTIYEVSVTPPAFARADVIKNRVGSHLVICDKVYSYKIINDKVKALNVGAGEPDQLITVILMGECYHLDPKKMKGQKICFRGIVSLRKGKTHMILSRLDQLTGYEQYE